MAEQAKGASEVAKAMAEVRRQAAHVAKAVAAQARSNQESEQAVRDVARLAGTVSKATAEQGKALVSLTTGGTGVRRAAHQLARAVAEHTGDNTSLAAELGRHAEALATVSREAQRQREASTRLGTLLESTVGPGREPAGATAGVGGKSS
jgi:methyl-accepting chemotaxis protein